MTFLAKSNGETLLEHTNNLLKQLNIFKTTYPNALSNKHWDLLAYACAYHDLGKINDKFQTKIRHKWMTIDGEIPHGLLSVTMIDFDALKKKFNDYELKALAYAVACHHNRDFSKLDKDHYKDEIKALKSAYSKLDLTGLLINLPTREPEKTKSKYYKFKRIWTLEGIDGNWLLTDEEKAKEKQAFMLYIKLKGLLNRLDYAASGHYQVESSPRLDLTQNVPDFIHGQYNNLQNWAHEHKSDNIVAIAQTGMGKTESALRWLNNDKSFFVLPLKSAINAMYKRFKTEVFSDDTQNIKQDMALLHSDMTSNVLANTYSYQDFQKQINEDRQWSKQLSIATLDQVFPFVYAFKGYEPRLATLSYSKVVIDEIQMYSPDLLAYIVYGLKEIQKYGGHFYIMTATLAPAVLDLLNQNNVNFIKSKKPFLDEKVDHRHKVCVKHSQLLSNDVLKLDQGKKTLVIVNTVKKADELYQELKNAGKNVHLIHSRFTRDDRKQKESDIYEFSNSNENGIWIGTQVVEASLDIDFDLLITELSELSGLFQRMGRCYRKRNYEGKLPNVYVFDGGEKSTSGISRGEQSVVDYQMFELSKNAIKSLSGYLTEQEKIDLINQNYTLKNLSNDEKNGFADKVKSSLKYLKSMQELHQSKSQVQRIFRNIQSASVIPEQVLENNQDMISKMLEDGTNKIVLRDKLNSLTVNVPTYVVKSENLAENKDLNELGYQILSKDFNYSSETGLDLKKQESEDDNFF